MSKNLFFTIMDDFPCIFTSFFFESWQTEIKQQTAPEICLFFFPMIYVDGTINYGGSYRILCLNKYFICDVVLRNLPWILSAEDNGAIP